MWARLAKTVAICVGKTSMIDFPPELERQQDLKEWGGAEAVLAQKKVLEELQREKETAALAV